ncbi:c-type cytochrome [Jiulongibacter sp. NS-SX5]|uniref:c-type cytochrome n=1 Tax=Jiulongibacter sp. NS-SX5 TaxID=3463854 RepID=UPI004059D60B
MNILRIRLSLFSALAIGLLLIGCNDPNKTGWEYAPNMYNSRAYEAQTQWRENGVNPHGMNMREPVEGTVSRRNYNTSFLQDDGSVVTDLMIYDTHPDSLEWAAENLTNPIPWSEQAEDEGKVLYQRNCQHCHGTKGAGDGKVAAIYKGVPNYSSDALNSISGGHIYHVITHGKGRMWPHAAQVLPEERWKIVHYVQRLQLGS